TNLTLANFTEANLQGADLSKSHLLNARFQRANLVDANLSNCELSGCDLIQANLEGSNLQGANIQWANLSEANLSRANLIGAEFRGSDLRQANFSDAIGLLPSALSGTDLAFAKLPKGFAEFEGLGVAHKLSFFYTAFLLEIVLLCIYGLWAILRTTDANLARAAGPLSLPLIGVTMSTARFYVVAPLIIVGIYVYFHVISQSFLKRIGSLPSVFPDGKPLEESLKSWYLRALVSSYPAREKSATFV